MNNLNYKKIFENYNTQPIGVDNKYSVLIPIIEVEGEESLLLEVRSKNLKSQPNEISFPGGKIEEGENFIEAAIRETCEELCLKEEDIIVYGENDFLVNPYRSIIYSVVGRINIDFLKIKASKDEVDEIFTVPLRFFIENKPDTYRLNIKVEDSEEFPYELIPNGKNYSFKRGTDEVIFYKYKDKVIWGFTAKLIQNFISKING